MDKIRNFVKELYSVDNVSRGLIVLMLGLAATFFIRHALTDLFGYFIIFITCIGVFTSISLLGYIVNKILSNTDN